MPDEPSPLESVIRRLIALAGPMPVASYMRLALTHPEHGYYLTRNPIGAAGDFVTAPEISQMFGELIGVWMAAVWQLMGAPENVRIIELGPGPGTLMSDALRAAKVVKDFHSAIVLHLVEISPALEPLQRHRLEGFKVPVVWHSAFEDVPGGPSIIIANEFIDALPINQAVKQADGWHERVIKVGPEGNFVYDIARDPLPAFGATLPRDLDRAPEGSIFEWRPDNFALELAMRVRKDGVALILDYGHTQSGLGDTLQAVSGHSFADPLRTPGQVDLTAHVDFEALGKNAASVGARCHGPVVQRDFLFNLGIHARASALKASATPEQALDIDLALSRLITGGPRGMGELFKVFAMSAPQLGPLPGFEKPK